MKHTHSDRLERWLGNDTVEQISQNFKNFYWPVGVHGVPGGVYVMPGGDFCGEIKAGQEMSKHDAAANSLKKLMQVGRNKARYDKALAAFFAMLKAEDDAARMSVGAFASIDAVVAAATGGKGQVINFSKLGTIVGAAAHTTDLFTKGNVPAAGSAASAAPGGVGPTSSTTGALPFKNLGVANSGHYLNWAVSATVANNSLLLYDRIFSVAKTMSSTTTEAVTGTPSRYQNSTAESVDYIGGNFCFPSVPTTALGAGAHNWTVCQYTDEAGNTGNSFASTAGVNGCSQAQIDIVAGSGWFLPLAAGDVGVKAITQMQCSASVTGTIDFVIGHPIAVIACPVANQAYIDDGLYTSLNLTTVLDNACLSFIELPKPGTSQCNYNGYIRFVSE